MGIYTRMTQVHGPSPDLSLKVQPMDPWPFMSLRNSKPSSRCSPCNPTALQLSLLCDSHHRTGRCTQPGHWGSLFDTMLLSHFIARSVWLWLLFDFSLHVQPGRCHSPGLHSRHLALFTTLVSWPGSTFNFASSQPVLCAAANYSSVFPGLQLLNDCPYAFQVSFVFPRWMPRSEMPGACGSSILKFWSSSVWFPQWLHQSASRPPACGAPFLHTSRNTALLSSLVRALLMVVRW